MITVRQIQRLWNSKAYERLLGQLIAPRPEASGRLVSHLTGPLPTAAMVVIRLDELAQTYVPLYSEMVCSIINAQRPDGGWGDVMATALCVRALMCGDGHGTAVERGLESLARLQKEEGIWPAMPVKRMPADAFASALVMLQLGDSEEFQGAVQFERAMEWFDSNELALDEETRKLWQHTKRRTNRVRGRKKTPIIPTGLAASAASSSSPQSAATASIGFWDFSAALISS